MDGLAPMKEYLDSLLRDYARKENNLLEWKGVEEGQLLSFSKILDGQRYIFTLIWERGRWEPLDWSKEL